MQTLRKGSQLEEIGFQIVRKIEDHQTEALLDFAKSSSPDTVSLERKSDRHSTGRCFAMLLIYQNCLLSIVNELIARSSQIISV